MNDGHGPNDDLHPGVCEAELHGSRVGRVRFALDQSGVLQCTSQLRDEDWLEPRPVSELALAWAGASASEAVQRGEQGVLGVRQAEWGQLAVHRGAQAGGEAPDQEAEGRVVGRVPHATIQYMETIAMDTVLSARCMRDRETSQPGAMLTPPAARATAARDRPAGELAVLTLRRVARPGTPVALACCLRRRPGTEASP